jgi:hypothetical protein
MLKPFSALKITTTLYCDVFSLTLIITFIVYYQYV